jgi:sialidase-1
MTRTLRMVVLVSLMAVGPSCAALHAQAMFDEEDVFVGGQDNINTYRIPALICTKKGTLLAFSEGRRDDVMDGTPTDLVLKRSVGNGGKWTPEGVPGPQKLHRSRQTVMTWQPMQTLIRSAHGEAYMNPVPLIDNRDGTIYLFVNDYPQPYADLPAVIWVMKSTDDGATWSRPVDITSSTGKHELGPGVGIQLRSGRLVVAVYDGVIYSDDHGKSWKAGGVAVGGKPDETQVVELTDGSLLLNRRAVPNRLVMLSNDKGLTWAKAEDDPASAGTNPDCEASLLRYTRKDEGYSKDRLLFANPADPKGRSDVTVRMSYDEGKTWPVAKLIRKGLGAYTSMTVFPDGSIGLLYETGETYGGMADYYRRIVLARFTLEWLTDGKDRLEK